LTNTISHDIIRVNKQATYITEIWTMLKPVEETAELLNVLGVFGADDTRG
jgi:hypothetical protein